MRQFLVYSFFAVLLPIVSFGQENYIRSWTPNKSITQEAAVESSAQSSPQEVSQTTQYFDGFGRPEQTVSKQASPLGKDVVNIHEYDSWGRETKRYMPFVSSTDNGNYKTNAISQLQTFNQTMFPNEGNYYYGEVDLEASPLSRTLKALSPGVSWVGSSRGVSTQYLVNTLSDGVRVWDVSGTAGALPVSTRLYSSNKLFKTITTDVDGLQHITYKNNEGQLILSKQQATASADNGNGSGHSGWLCTYYVYDDYNNLRVIIPPKAVQSLDGSWSVSQALVNGLCFRFEYDKKGRTIIEQNPGAEAKYVVYDPRDRPVFTQDGNQRSNHQWLITFYDGLDRITETGLYTDVSATRESLQAMMDGLINGGGSGGCDQIPAPNDLVVSSRSGNEPAEYIARNSITFMPGFEAPAGDEFTAVIDPNATIDDPNCEGVPFNIENPVPPIILSKVTPLTYTYYDDYSWSGHQAFQSSYLSKTTDGDNPFAENPTTYSHKTRGLVTGTKVRTLNASPNKWLTTTTYYDDKGRALQTLSANIAGGVDVSTSKYDFSGKLLSSYTVIKNTESNVTPTTRVLTENHYDNGGRLLTVTKTINDQAATERTIATYSYDELSQLQSETLGNDLETLNYTHNIRGWLIGINKGYTESGNTSHYFGMELGYNKSATEAGTTTFTPKYNGNISGQIWKSKGDGIPRKYDFSYDNANRLTGAAFNQNSSGSTWDHTTVDFSVNNIDYDANGNITALSQHGLKGSSSPLIDNLSYTYPSNSNQLSKVTDGANDPNTTLGDFHDGSNTGNDYAYDNNGNLTKDLNKRITSITYNIFNLPKEITFSGKGNIKFIYDALGNKLQKIITDNTGTQTQVTTIDYIDGFVYKNDTLSFFPTENGRVRYVPEQGTKPSYYTYDYFIADHLGNTRMVLTEQTDFSQYLATLEPENTQKEDALFYNLAETRVPKPADYPEDNTTSSNKAIAKLNGEDPNKRIGPSIILKVMAGDTIQAAVRAYYKTSPEPEKKASIPAEQMLTGLVQALVAPEQPVISTHGDQLSSFSSSSGSGLTANDLHNLKNTDPQNQLEKKPQAYLNYVFFDKQLNFVEQGSGVKQVDGPPGELETLASGKVVAKKDGYIYVFTSNESAEDVFFDNLGVTQVTGPILEETHYYPSGLTMAAISTVAPLKIANRHKFNGIELNRGEFSDGSGLELYTAELRALDPQIGRWWQVDPKTASFASWSPYNAMQDNPVIFSDPDGDCPVCIVAIVAGVVNGIINVGSQAISGNVQSLGQGLEYFAVGAVAGAAYVIPGGGLALAGSIQAGGNKLVQYINGQWDPSDIHSAADWGELALDLGTDFLSPELGANIGKAIAPSLGWKTSANFSGKFLQNGADITSGFTFSGTAEVTATRTGNGIAKFAELEAAKSSTAVFRAVDATESAIIQNTGRFSLRQGGVEVKYFAKSLEDANWYGQRLYPNGYSIIKGTVQGPVNAAEHWFSHVDIGAYVFPKEALPYIIPH